MMRPRRTSAIVTLSLLALGATAHAESPQSLPECKRAAQSDDVMKMLAESRRVEAAITAVCLPDTVDPRRPKGR